MEMLLPILKADTKMFETYQYLPGAALACPIYAIAGEQDPQCPPASMAGWKRETSGAFFAETVAGKHFFINNAVEPGRAATLKGLRYAAPIRSRPDPYRRPDLPHRAI